MSSARPRHGTAAEIAGFRVGTDDPVAGNDDALLPLTGVGDVTLENAVVPMSREPAEHVLRVGAAGTHAVHIPPKAPRHGLGHPIAPRPDVAHQGPMVTTRMGLRLEVRQPQLAMQQDQGIDRVDEALLLDEPEHVHPVEKRVPPAESKQPDEIEGGKDLGLPILKARRRDVPLA